MEALKTLITPETGAIGIAGLGGFWLVFKRFLVKNAMENTNLSATDAYSEIINTLREEVGRLSETNTKLAKALNDLQAENINLKHEIAQLHNALNSMRERLGIISDLPPSAGDEYRKP